jgi:hypothetical protein
MHLDMNYRAWAIAMMTIIDLSLLLHIAIKLY